MKSAVRAATFCLITLASIAGWGQAGGSEDAFGSIASLLEPPSQPASSATPLSLDDVERIALQVNPELAVARRRLAMAQAHVPIAGALDDPMAMYRGWGIPLKRPWDYNAAQSMFSVSQTFVSRTKRNLRSSIAGSDVDQAQANLDQVRLDLTVRVRKAFFGLLLTQEEIQVHEQHVAIAQHAIGAARIKYTAGSVPQQDILKAQIAMTQLAEHMIRFDRDAEVSRARLNTLLGRNPDAPLELRGQLAVFGQLPTIDTLLAMAYNARPDLAAAKVAAVRSHKEQQLAAKAFTPDFTLSTGYMLMPSGQDFRNAYMVEGSMNLPWLNRKKHDSEIAEAALKATEQDAELSALQNMVRGQIAEALVETQAAQKMALLYQKQLKPQAEAALQSSVIAYENNKAGFLDLLDSQMRVVDLGLAGLQAVGEFDDRIAELQMVTGTTLDNLPQTNVEVK